MSFVARPGATISLQDSTGDGQATLLGLLLGLHPVLGGTITLDGVDVASLPLAETRRQIAVVLSEPWLIDGSVADNIKFGRADISRDRIRTSATLACLDEANARLPQGLDSPVGVEGANLTVGQRRQVALARALATDPSVLLVEEPTGGIGARERTMLLKAMDRAALGRTTIIAGRHPEAIKPFDTTLVLHHGTVTVAGNHAGPPPTEPASAAMPVPDAPTASGPDPADEATSVVVPLPPEIWRANDGRSAVADRPDGDPSVVDRFLRRACRRRDGARSAWDIEIGSQLAPGYRAAGLLDRSARTETWLAWSSERTEAVTVRIPRRSPVTFTAFEELNRECRTARYLRHPGIMAVVDHDLEAELPHVAYERVPGRSVSACVRACGPLSSAEVLSIGYEVARTLDHLHRRGYVHLDLRPDGVARAPWGAVLTDLRLALPIGEQRVRFVERHHHGFVAPELVRGSAADPAMDVYALGALLYQTATGVLVDDAPAGDDILVLDHRCDRRRRPAVELASTVDPTVADLAERFMADRAGDRPTAAEAVAELRPLLLRALPGIKRAA